MPLRAVLADVCEADSMFQDGAGMAVVVRDRLAPLGNLHLSLLVCRIACLLDLRQDEVCGNLSDSQCGVHSSVG